MELSNNNNFIIDRGYSSEKAQELEDQSSRFIESVDTLFGIEFPTRFSDIVLSYISKPSFFKFSRINKEWYQKIQGKAFKIHALKIQGKENEYLVKYYIDRKDREEILQKTGFDVPFPEGQDFVEDFLIGKGADGEFRILYSIKKAHYLGVKITQIKNDKDDMIEEINLQQSLSHLSHVMPSIDYCMRVDAKEKKTIFHIMPFAGLGTFHYIRKPINNLDPISFERAIYCLLKDFFEGISEIHGEDCCHSDVRSENVVTDHLGISKIIDFGRSSKMNNNKIKPRAAHRGYYAPERFISEEYYDGRKLDAWAAGLVAWELVTAQDLPFDYTKLQDMQLWDEVRTYFEEKLPNMMQLLTSKNYRFVIEKLLTVNPNRRSTVKAVLQDSWFTQMQKESATWESEVRHYLKELVQSALREKNCREKSNLSPQDLPYPHFSNYIERKALQEELKKRFLMPYMGASPVIVCQGDSGVGKTKLITYMLHQMHDYFGLKLWFSSCEKIFLDAQHTILAKELKLLRENSCFEETLKILQKYLAEYPKRFGKPWIIVYDDAKKASQLARYLPEKGGIIVVITKFSDWPDSLKIESMTPFESKALVSKLLQCSDKEAIQNLCEKLSHHPLGLAQACAYMRNEQTSINEYILKLSNCPPILEKNERLFGINLPYSLKGSWQITFGVLAQKCPEALESLDYLAYLLSDKMNENLIPTPKSIPNQIAALLMKEKIFKTLQEYGLIVRNITSFSMHPLLQSTHSLEKKEQILKELIQKWNSIYIEQPKNLAEFETSKQLFLQGLALLAQYEDADFILDNNFAYSLFLLLRHLAHLHQQFGNLVSSKNLLEKALVVSEQTFGLNNYFSAKILSDLSSFFLEMADSKNALHYLQKARKIEEEIGIKELLNDPKYFTNLGEVYSRLKDYQTAHYFLTQAVTIMEQNLQTQSPQYGKVLHSLAKVLHNQGQIPSAMDQLQKSSVILSHTFGEDHIEIASIHNTLGLLLIDLKRFEEGINHLSEALNLHEQIFGKEHYKIATILNNLAHACLVKAKTPNTDKKASAQLALTFLERALKINLIQFGENHFTIANNYHESAIAWILLDNRQKVINFFEKELHVNLQIKDDPRTASTLTRLGHVCYLEGQLQKALNYFKSALAFEKNIISSNDLKVAKAFRNVGKVYRSLLNANHARIFFEEALRIHERFEENFSEIAIDRLYLAEAYWELMNSGQKAIDFFENGLYRQDMQFEDSSDFPSLLSSLGLWKWFQGETQNAILCWKECLDHEEKNFGKNHFNVAIRLNNLGWGYRNSNEFEKAIECFDRALEIALAEKNSPFVVTLLNNLADAWQAKGDKKTATSYYQRALEFQLEEKIISKADALLKLNHLGKIWETLGQLKKAEALYRKVLEIRLSQFNDRHPLIAEDFFRLGVILNWERKPEEALQWIQKAYSIAEEHNLIKKEEYKNYYDNIVRFQLDKG